jgi:hypothetical protein
MGRFIQLDRLGTDDDGWIMPCHLRRYDQRAKPWPNDLFPFGMEIPAFFLQDEYQMVMVRRAIEQTCRGDVAVEGCYTESSLSWNLWFQHEDDCNLMDGFVRDLLEST